MACHSRIVAQYDTAIVALSCAVHHDPAESDSVVIVDLGTPAGPTELGESDAIRLLGTLEVAGEGPAWLIEALRSALELLDPQAGWVRRPPSARALGVTMLKFGSNVSISPAKVARAVWSRGRRRPAVRAERHLPTLSFPGRPSPGLTHRG